MLLSSSMQRCIIYLFFVFIFLALYNCAKRGTPSGGDKDETPPVVIRAEPEMNTVRFTGKKIRIYFDEYIKLKDIQKQLIVSPPLQYTPEISPQGSAAKYLEIKIKDTLKPNTTYVFNFGQSIVDNNEGNPYDYFKYVFSTGDYIDSLTVSGFVQDALLKEPDPYISVMLYAIDSTYTDSIIYKKPPTYITNTLDSLKSFEITNVKAGSYRILALKDNAGNYVFDQQSDKIAFLDSVIQVPSASPYTLTLFKEAANFRASRPVLASKNKMIFGYEGNADSMKIQLLSETPADYKWVLTKDREKDSLYYWFTPFEADSLIFRIQNDFDIDTFTIKTRDLYNDSLVVKPNYSGNLPLQETFALQLNTPLKKQDSSKIALLNKDSVSVAFKSIIDTEDNALQLDFDVLPEERYSFRLLPGALEDFFGNTNDTLSYNLTTKAITDYGSIHITLQNVNTFPVIVQLTDEKGNMERELYGSEDAQSFHFRNIDPGKYLIRVIYDTNSNGKWDTGNYLQKLQPEKVIYYPEILDVRENWELDQTFILSN